MNSNAVPIAPDLARPRAPAWFDAALAQRPDETTVTVDGKRLEALVWGPTGAPGLLLLHGNMAHAHWWSFLAPFFADRFRVAAFSFSGMGRSDHAAHYSLEGFAAEALAIAAHCGLTTAGRFAVVGHSAGGGVATRLAVDHPECLNRAILIDTLIAPGTPAGEPVGKVPRRYATIEEAVSRYRLSPPQPHDNPFIIDHIARHSLRQGTNGWTWAFDPVLRGRFSARPVWPDLDKAGVPLAFINGGRSSVVTPERRDAMRARLPGAQFLQIPNAHHHVIIDSPFELVAMLGDLLAPQDDDPLLG